MIRQSESTEPINLALHISILHVTNVATQMNCGVDEVVAMIVTDKIDCYGGIDTLTDAATNGLFR